MGSICLYIGIQDSAENLGLPKTNFWIYPNENYESVCDTFKESSHYSDDTVLPMVYISFPSAKDPDFNNRYPGKATIEIVAPCMHEWFFGGMEQLKAHCMNWRMVKRGRHPPNPHHKQPTNAPHTYGWRPGKRRDVMTRR